MIVRNEAPVLRECLESAAPIVDEINIIDTGSTDDTRAIARDFGARLQEIEWIDFSDARNQSLAMASGDWVLVLDADERLIYEDPDILQRVISGPDAADLYSMQIFNVHEATKPLDLKKTAISYHERFFCRDGARFVNPVHERAIVPPGSRLSTLANQGIAIIHYGYREDVVARQGKKDRNSPLIQAWHEAEPENPEAIFHRAAQLYDRGLFEDAADLYRQAIPGLMERELSIQSRAVVSLAQCYANLERVDDLFQTLEDGVDKMPESVEIHFFLGSALLESGRTDTAIKHLRECLKIGEGGTQYALSFRGAGGWWAMDQLATVFSQKGDEEKAFLAACLSRLMDDKPLFQAEGAPLSPDGRALYELLQAEGVEAGDKVGAYIFEDIKPG